jgi:hypothetical protein
MKDAMKRCALGVLAGCLLVVTACVDLAGAPAADPAVAAEQSTQTDQAGDPQSIIEPSAATTESVEQGLSVGDPRTPNTALSCVKACGDDSDCITCCIHHTVCM